MSSRLLALSLFLFLSAGFSHAQLYEENLPSEQRTNGKTTLREIEPQREVLQKISAVIQSGNTPLANGTIMSKDGYILTKAEAIHNARDLSIRIGKTLYNEVKILGTDPDTDLALLKISPKEDLTLPEWFSPPEIGTIVIANGATTRTTRRARLGIVSARTRPIPDHLSFAIIGVAFDPNQNRIISDVYPEFAAALAGIEAGDELIAINDKPLSFPEDVVHLLQGHKKGDSVLLTVLRKGKELKLRGNLVPPPTDRNDVMSGRYNTRRSNFPESIQHDIPLSIYNSGGPLITLDGKTVGINIARANRAESFALTAKVVRETFQKLLAKDQKKPS